MYGINTGFPKPLHWALKRIALDKIYFACKLCAAAIGYVVIYEINGNMCIRVDRVVRPTHN